LWRWLGFEFAVNHSKRFRRFWEYYLCYVVRGKVIEWRLEAIKGHPDRRVAKAIGYIENFLAGTGAPYDWDDFISIPTGDVRLDAARHECNQLSERFPPGNEGGFCNEAGFERLREILRELKQE